MGMPNRHAALLTLFLCTLSQAAHAQDTTKVIAVDTITVSITRATTSLTHTPASISILTSPQIQLARPAISLDESLAEVPGVQVSNRYNFAQGTRISIRGFGSRSAFGVRGIRLIQDGIPLTMPDGQSNLNNLDLGSAGRIEIMRGAASSLHGNAAGGVIEIRSEEPDAGFSTEVRAVGGSFGQSGLNNMTKFSSKIGGGTQTTRYLVSAARIETDGFRDHSRFEQTNLNARATHSFAGARTSLTLNIVDSPVAEDPGSLPRDSAERKPAMAWARNVETGAGKTGRQAQGGIEHQQRLLNADLNATVYALTRSLENPLTFAYIELDRKAHGARTTLSWPHVTIGIDAEAQSDVRNEFNNAGGQPGSQQRRDQTDRIRSVGPFVRAAVERGRLGLTAGVRYDRLHFAVEDRLLSDGHDDSGARTMSAASPSVGVTYNFTPGATLFVNGATAFQTPTTTEMINTPPAPGQACCAAGFNPLNPERARSFELGARMRHQTFNLEAAIFHIRTRDKIVPFQVANGEGRDFYRNAGVTRQRGAEISASVATTRNTRMTASYTYSDFVFIDDGLASAAYEGNQMPGVPPHHLLLRMQAAARGVSVEPEVEWTASYYADDANTAGARNDAYTVANVRIASLHAWGGALMPFVTFNNIFDARYSGSVVINAAGARYFEPAPGFNVYVGLGVQAGHGGLRK